MKTFLTEKGNIPEGVTHYLNETDTDCFAWYREDTKEVMVGGYMAPEWESAGKDENLADMKPIPQAKTETPGEKEVEWANGDIATYEGKQALVIAYHPHHPSVVIELPDNEYLNVLASELSKPETEAERVERERNEWIEKFAYKVKHVGTMTYKDILGEMYDSLK